MTDVIDDSLSWEQRRELRRKKRQELLAEADRLVNTDKVTVSSRISQDKSTDDGDSFEQERQKRRREREEKRKKEREDLEKQLKEEEEARTEREKRREERRRQREEGDTISTRHNAPKESYSYSSSTTVTTRSKTVHDSDGDEEEEDVVEQVVTEVNEVMSNGQEDYPAENGDDEIAVQNGHHAEDKDEEDEVEVDYNEEVEEVQEDDSGTKTYKSYTTITTITTSSKSRDVHESSSSSSSDAEEEREEIKQKESADSRSSSDHEEEAKPAEEVEDAPKSRAELLQEKRKQRERERLEEEKRQEEEAEMRKAEYEAKLKVEKEERERRMAEGEAKRKEFRKQSSLEPTPLSPKGNAASPLIMKSDDTASTPDVILKSKLKKDRGKMETVKKPSYPTRTQSTHVRSNTTSPGTPSRPIARKNQTRRSLNALEKQAGDLYSFLSELEDKKSAGPRELKEFLDQSERAEKGYPQVAPAHGQSVQKRASIRDRMKQFSSIGEENKQPVEAKKDRVPCKIVVKTSISPARTPQPPKRSDSMKRLELARSKHAGRNVPYRPLSPASALIKSQLPPPAEIENETSISIDPEESDKAIEEISSHRDTSSDTSSQNEESLQLKIDFNITAKVDTKSEATSYAEEFSLSTDAMQTNEITNKDVVQIRPNDVNNTHAVQSGNKCNYNQSSKDTSVEVVEIEKKVVEDSDDQNFVEESPEKENKISSQADSRRMRTRNRGNKPNLPPRPTGLADSPSCSPHRRPVERPKSENVESNPSSSISSSAKYSSTVKSKTIPNDKERVRESLKDVKSEEEEKEARREARRARRRNNDASSATDRKSTDYASDKPQELHTTSMKNLSEKMTDSPKPSKVVDTKLAKIHSLDDRVKNYTSHAQKQETAKKGVVTPKSGGRDVANRLNMWETGRVTGGERSRKVLDTDVVKTSAGVSSRKNMWETGKVTSSSEKKSARPDVHGANFSSRKDMWLKASQESNKSTPSKDGPVPIKTGVMSRLNKWEKGEVTGAATTPKAKGDLPVVSDVVNRRSKWENIAKDSPSQQTKTTVVRTMITTDVSSRKNAYLTKAEKEQTPKAAERKPISTGRVQKEEPVKQEIESSDEEEEEVREEPVRRRRESLSSSESGSDADDKYRRELSDSESEGEQRQYGRPASSGSDLSDRE